jgi:hypothetical protein
VTVIKIDNRRYATVEGPAVIHPWPDDSAKVDAHVKLLKDVYIAMGRTPKQSAAEFAQTMADEKRSVIAVTPESTYGSLTQG